MAGLLTIGEVAEAVGVATSALRYYDEIGLVRPAARVSGQRRYSPAELNRLRVVNHCRRAGFTLDEIAGLLDEEHGWQARARDKRHELEQRIADLRQAAHIIDAALACDCRSLEGCEGRHHHAERERTEDDLPPGRSLTDPTRTLHASD